MFGRLTLTRREWVTDKLTKEELREDPVLSALLRTGQTIREKSLYLIIGVGVVVAAVAVAYFVRQSKTKGEQQAAILVMNAEQQIQSQNLQEALKAFQQAGEQHGGTPSGEIAILRAADLQMEMGEVEEARKLYAKYVGSDPEDPFLRASGLRGLAGALESLGQKEEAGRRFLEAAAIVESPLRADDCVSAGLAFLDAGKLDEAREAFRKVMVEFPESPRIRDAREGLEAVRARSGS